MGDQQGTALDGQPLSYVPRHVFQCVEQAALSAYDRAELVADLCRVNVLYMIARAGAGHIGSSFSSLEIMSWLLLEELDRAAPNCDGNLYFSSKGHDAPAFYALLIALGHLPEAELHSLRRLGGLPGHPDVATKGVLTNTGSLGMGISKAKGMILAQRARAGVSEQRRVFVLTGDGELQEGQIWESLASAVRARMSELTVIIDHKRLQSDGYVSETSDLGDLRAKLESFGFRVSRIAGHSVQALQQVLKPSAATSADLPHAIIAETVKGRGVSFMEASELPPQGIYRFHSGAPQPAQYDAALAELRERCQARFVRHGLGELTLVTRAARPALPQPLRVQRLPEVYGRKLLALMATREDLFALDADLCVDLGLRPIKEQYPERFIECGIAEMDMVSQAGGLALRGALPVCHSFASFLSARPNEHIYNNASERTRVVYTAGLAGLLPAGPGHSHQGVRDIAALSGIPGLVMFQPCDAAELERALDHALAAPHSTYLRLCSVPWALPFTLPSQAPLVEGCGVSLRAGRDGLVIAYGPVMLSQAYLAAELLEARHGLSLEVVNLPWLNRVDADWLTSTVGTRPWLFSIDDHYLAGGQGQLLAATLLEAGGHVPRLRRFGVNELPACGAPDEVLAHHGLDAQSLYAAMRVSYEGSRDSYVREITAPPRDDSGSNHGEGWTVT
ncbi:MAG: transketolase C-terminal domain-containing protein [Polyangiales bacterium]